MRPGLENGVTIAGGGLAGAAAACHLARAGRRVTLFERTAGPADKICGECLGPGAQRELASLGIDLAALGAHRIDRLRLVRGRQCADVRLPFVAAGLTRRRLDEALLDRAAASGAAIHRGQAFEAPQAGPVFLATGKHELRAHPRQAEASDLVGFKSYFRVTPAQHAMLQHTIELHLFPDGYAGLQLVEHAANLCLLVSRARLQAAGGDWPHLLASLRGENPILAARLEGAAELLDRPLAIARVPFGYVHDGHADDAPELYRLGDQAGVIHAFTGDGMSLALGSARLAAGVLLAGGAPDRYARELRRRISGPIARSQFLYRLGQHRAGQRGLIAVAAIMPTVIGSAARLTRSWSDTTLFRDA